jgi:hypothetical protein
MRRARAVRLAASAGATLPGLEAGPAKAGNKFNAKRTKGVGPTGVPRHYASKAEAVWTAGLNHRRHCGDIVAWVPQVSLESGVDETGRSVRYLADALIILEVFEDGSFRGRLADRKGIDTPASRAKRAALRSLYGLDVEVIGDV